MVLTKHQRTNTRAVNTIEYLEPNVGAAPGSRYGRGARDASGPTGFSSKTKAELPPVVAAGRCGLRFGELH